MSTLELPIAPPQLVEHRMIRAGADFREAAERWVDVCLELSASPPADRLYLGMWAHHLAREVRSTLRLPDQAAEALAEGKGFSR
ncbi:unnamed protein product [marine sediment metagenome]|uniref:Uncharacterized protein n=1 Tax=marine sediment metagenome TaxID=412755 RepID=X0TAE4_9ZZZZ